MILQANSSTGPVQDRAGCNKIVLSRTPVLDRIAGVSFLGQASFAVVTTGDVGFALRPELKTMFLNLATQCETVVCCRVSPAQKLVSSLYVKH